jgi:hypothetical protein
MLGYGVVLVIAAAGSWLVTFVARTLAIRCGAIDVPEDR